MKKLAEDKNIIIFEKTTHKIEVFGFFKIITQISGKSILIKLLNVILVLEYLTNLICLDWFKKKSIFHDSKNNRLHRKNEIYC